jgi:hypothetical protein
MDNNKSTDQSAQSARLSYAAPQLLVYGAISDLTSGGSGLIKENNAMVNAMKHP